MTATRKQIETIVAELVRREIVINGKLVLGWGHLVGLPTPPGVSSYHDDPYRVFAGLDNDGVGVMFRKLSIR